MVDDYRRGIDWDEQVPIILKAVGQGKIKPSWQAIGERMGVNRASVLSAFHVRGIDFDALRGYAPDSGIVQSLVKEEAARELEILFEDKKEVDPMEWRELAELAKDVQRAEKRSDDSQRIAHVKISTKKPIGLMFTGDWHLGDLHTDHNTWQEDIQFVLDTDGLFMIDLGDDRQNMRTFRVLSSVLNQALSPKQQAIMLKGVVEELTEKKKMVAKIGGNHDEEFDQRLFGQALQSYLLRNMKAPRFKGRGLLKLKVGKSNYSILMFHKSRFKSFLRRTHGNFREHQLSYPADVVAGGHDHEPGMEHLFNYNLAAQAGDDFGGETIFIKIGTYQDSEYGWRYFHNGGFPQNYTVVFFPDVRKMVPFPNPRDAMQYVSRF